MELKVDVTMQWTLQMTMQLWNMMVTMPGGLQETAEEKRMELPADQCGETAGVPNVILANEVDVDVAKHDQENEHNFVMYQNCD